MFYGNTQHTKYTKIHTGICLECQSRFEMLIALKKHAETAHKQTEHFSAPPQSNQVNVLFGVCQQHKLYSDKQDYIALQNST